MLQYVTVCCSVLVAACCSVLQCVAVRCSVLQCVAVCCSVSQCVAVCCSVLQCVAVCCKHMNKILKHNVCTCVTMCVCVCVCAMCVWCFVPLKRQHSTSASSCMSRQCEQKVAAKGNGGNKSSQICKIRDETLVLCCPVASLHE